MQVTNSKGRRFALAFDIDGVLANFADAAIYLVNQKFGTNLKFEDWDKYGDVHTHPDAFTDEQWRYMWDSFLATPRFWFDLEAFEPKTLQLLGELAAYGEILLYFTTKRRDITTGPANERDCRLLTKWWLNKHGITDTHAIIAGQQNRVQILGHLEVDAYLDDYAPQANEVMFSGGVPKTVLINRPWNVNEPCDCPRVDTVVDFLAEVHPDLKRLYDAAFNFDRERTTKRLMQQFGVPSFDGQAVKVSNILVP